MLSHVPRAVLLLFALCLLGACVVHVVDLWQHGWLPYHFAPFPLNAYWTALTFPDAVAAVLLLCRPRTGLALALLIIASDVALNPILSLLPSSAPSDACLVAAVAFLPRYSWSYTLCSMRWTGHANQIMSQRPHQAATPVCLPPNPPVASLFFIRRLIAHIINA